MVSHIRHLQSSDPLLAELTRLYGVQTSYRDSRGRWRESPVESIVQVLRALGAELGDGDAGDPLRGVTPSRITTAIRERKRQLWSRVLEPVIVAWEGKLPPVLLRVLAGGHTRESVESLHRGLSVTLVLEGEAEACRVATPGPLEAAAQETIGRSRFESYFLPSLDVPMRRLPLGRHRLRVETGGLEAESTVISAPRRCWSSRFPISPDGEDHGSLRVGGTDDRAQRGSGSSAWALSDLMAGRAGRAWGVFAPLYALRSARDWGAGDLAELEALLGWVADQGGALVATLPLLASYLDRPFEPAPYRPVSRLFWNELYLAVDHIPEWERCMPARDLWGSGGVQARLRRLRAEAMVDYREVMALKRSVLEELARCFFESGDSGREKAFAAYMCAHPHAEEYASFRARTEAVGRDWRNWPVPWTPGRTKASVERCSAAHYHLYCQWQMEQQLTRLSEDAGTDARSALMADSGPCAGSSDTTILAQHRRGLFLDLPVGVHPGGFDTWRWPELFAAGMSTGAPPDDFFVSGQDWTVSPLHPGRVREQGHSYFAHCLQHHMHHSCWLRIDHVMALHRVFWVPVGAQPAHGVYVEYPADELYAVLCLESQRHRTTVVGEDLGTVPPGVRSAMRKHGLLRTWVLQTSLRPRRVSPVGPAPRRAVAALNTHDMFPLAGFLRGDDIAARVETGQLDQKSARRELAARRRMVRRLTAFASPTDPGDAGLLHAVLVWLAAGKNELVLVNLEDLLLEARPQNLPGTAGQRGNWQRKLAMGLEGIFASDGILGAEYPRLKKNGHTDE